MDGTIRKNIRSGSIVVIVKKEDQRTGRGTQGVVKDILTSKAVHPRGIKVRLESGEVGRVQYIMRSSENSFPAVLAPFDPQRLQNSSKYARYSSSSFSRFGPNGIQKRLGNEFSDDLNELAP